MGRTSHAMKQWLLMYVLCVGLFISSASVAPHGELEGGSSSRATGRVGGGRRDDSGEGWSAYLGALLDDLCLPPCSLNKKALCVSPHVYAWHVNVDILVGRWVIKGEGSQPGLAAIMCVCVCVCVG